MALPEEALLKMADAVAQKQLKQDGNLSFEALLVYIDVLTGQRKGSEARGLLAGPCGEVVHIPHELLRLKVRDLCISGARTHNEIMLRAAERS